MTTQLVACMSMIALLFAEVLGTGFKAVLLFVPYTVEGEAGILMPVMALAGISRLFIPFTFTMSW